MLDRDEITGVATAGDVRLLPLLIEAERRREAGVADQVDLGGIPDTASLFAPSEGRVVPGWLRHLIPSEQ